MKKVLITAVVIVVVGASFYGAVRLGNDPKSKQSAAVPVPTPMPTSTVSEPQKSIAASKLHRLVKAAVQGGLNQITNGHFNLTAVRDDLAEATGCTEAGVVPFPSRLAAQQTLFLFGRVADPPIQETAISSRWTRNPEIIANTESYIESQIDAEVIVHRVRVTVVALVGGCPIKTVA